MNNAAATQPISAVTTVPVTVNAAAAVPCADYFPKTGPVAHVNFNPNWWDTTTTPLPWVQPNTIPHDGWQKTHVAPPITVTTGTYFPATSQAEKAEIVLAVLLNVLMGKSYVELANRVVKDGELQKIEFIYQESGLMIRIPKKMRYLEIVNALYEEFGNLRGRELK